MLLLQEGMYINNVATGGEGGMVGAAPAQHQTASNPGGPLLEHQAEDFWGNGSLMVQCDISIVGCTASI